MEGDPETNAPDSVSPDAPDAPDAPMAPPANPSPEAEGSSPEAAGGWVVHRTGAPSRRLSAEDVRPFDFRQPVLLSPAQLRRLRLRHEEFIRALEARLSLYLRMEFGLRLAGLDTQSFREFIESLAQPTHLTLFKADPLPGTAVIEVPPRLGLTIVDRLLGGPGQAIKSEPDLSEIELALLAQAVQVVLGEWCGHWVDLLPLRPVLLGTETNGRFLPNASPETPMLVLRIEGRLGECEEALRLAFPYFTLEPLVAKLSPAAEPVPAAKSPAPKVAWNPYFSEVDVPLTAEWDGLDLPARRIASLRVGDVLPLDAGDFDRVQLRLAGLCKFHGRLGTSGDHWAVEVTQVLKS